MQWLECQRVLRVMCPFCTFVDNVCVKLNSFGLTRLHGAQRDVDLVMQYFQYGWPDLPEGLHGFHVIEDFSTRKEKAAGRSLGPIILLDMILKQINNQKQNVMAIP